MYSFTANVLFMGPVRIYRQHNSYGINNYNNKRSQLDLEIETLVNYTFGFDTPSNALFHIFSILLHLFLELSAYDFTFLFFPVSLFPLRDSTQSFRFITFTPPFFLYLHDCYCDLFSLLFILHASQDTQIQSLHQFTTKKTQMRRHIQRMPETRLVRFVFELTS